MRWVLAPMVRADIAAFSGVNLGGARALANVHPLGGRQGQDIDGNALHSVVVVGPVGTRVVFSAAPSDDDWESRPWRAIVITGKNGFLTAEGKHAVRVPDIELFDKPDARRTDPDFEQDFPQVATLAEGTGWTYGRAGRLRNAIAAIRIDKV